MYSTSARISLRDVSVFLFVLTGFHFELPSGYTMIVWVWSVLNRARIGGIFFLSG